MTKAVLSRLRRIPNSFWEKRSPSPYGHSGVFDIIGCLQGFFVAIELKAPGKYQSPYVQGCTDAQKKYFWDVKSAKGIVVVSDEFNGIKNFLDHELARRGRVVDWQES